MREQESFTLEQAQASIGTLALFLLLAPLALQSISLILTAIELRIRRRPAYPWWWIR